MTAASKSQARELELLRQALYIRTFEEELLKLFRDGHVGGTVHTCIGQELCAVALHDHLDNERDVMFATHRGHGHYLAYGGPADGLMAELASRDGAVCRGRGGSQHLHWRRFFSNGIQGASAPQAVGFAEALKREGNGGICVVQLGDGTLGEGVVYEALTFAALRQVPVLFFLEFNGWAQSTDTLLTTTGDLEQRVRGFGLNVDRRDDTDLVSLHAHLGNVVANMRTSRRPFMQIIDTRRLMGHSKGDDERPDEVIQALWRNDPLERALADDASRQRTRQAVKAEIARLSEIIRQRPMVADDHRAASLPPLRCCPDAIDIHASAEATCPIVGQLNAALHDLMERDDGVFLLGEDLQDPYGGAFKVTRGLSSRFFERVFSTPISEAAILGMASGMALAGMRPIAEVMFADFVTLAADQLINSAAKFHYMFGGEATCPLTCRLVSGGGRGYGPTHSQSPERLFCGEPGLRVVALSHRHSPQALLEHVVLNDDAPTLFVENKLLYARHAVARPPPGLRFSSVPGHPNAYPPLVYRPTSGTADVTIVTYGGMGELVEAAMHNLLLEDEVLTDYIILTQLWPTDSRPIVDSVRKTRRLLVVEPHVAAFGVGAAIVRDVAEQIDGTVRLRAIGADPLPIPCARHLEDAVLITSNKVVSAVRGLLGEQ